jgi:NAD(P)H-dependent FMN reductase
MYESDGQGDSIRRAQEKYFIPASKWIMISPEYNGSYPGALKLMIDALSVREADRTFKNKKVALVGISSGRAGNWLGMNHLTSILNYLKMNVFYNKLAIRNISAVLNDRNELTDSKTRSFIEKQMEDFLSF